MTEPKYTLYPGHVQSETDGQWHQVSAHQLAILYGVQMGDCMIVRVTDASQPWMRKHVERAAQLIALRPRADGDYRLPTA